MKKLIPLILVAVFFFGTAFVLVHSEKQSEPANDILTTHTEWALNATAIEACTCPMFCQCYFNTEPAAHSHGHEHGEDANLEHYCKFNMAWKVNSGHYGNTDLEGALFWLAGDLGEYFGDASGDWAILHFDPSVSESQREGLSVILAGLFPANYEYFGVHEDLDISWSASTTEAVALLDNGNAAEMRLIHPPTAMSEEPAVLTNVIYWGAPRHDGFIMMPNEVQAYRLSDNAFESSGSNGFMITVDINSNDI